MNQPGLQKHPEVPVPVPVTRDDSWHCEAFTAHACDAPQQGEER